MDRNAIIGIVLIFILFYVWAKVNAPTPEQIEQAQRLKDSIAQSGIVTADTLPSPVNLGDSAVVHSPEIVDSLRQSLLSRDFGIFASAAKGEDQVVTIENDQLRLEINSKGGSIKRALIKPYKKLIEDENKQDVFLDLYLLEDRKNKFEFLLPVPGTLSGYIRSSDLFFHPEVSGRTLTLKATLTEGRSIVQRYTIPESGYGVDYELQLNGLANVLNPTEPKIQLNWHNYLDKIEKNAPFEKISSTIYFKEALEDPDYCSATSDDQQILDQQVKWVSHSNQFFSSTLIAEDQFSSAKLETRTLEDTSEDLKLLTTQLDLPWSPEVSSTWKMHWYIGPNEFDALKAYGYQLEDIVPFGWSFFGSINRWVIRPIFSFLTRFIGSHGLVILLLTLIVKSLVFPLTYRMLYSQSKMTALKPQMDKLREKYKDDQQKVQMETMKIYREYGVNPAGGCFPMLLQMPIWFALYRFFPASIEFRQAPFLWANDLSSYDVFVRLPFQIPFLGEHLSLFTFLWAASMILYTYYNSKFMDMSSMNAMPALKYMQYIMPIMFIFFFNSYASGLTCYLLFSNLLNIGQTVATKNFLINQEKILEELDANKKKPKKKGGFQERLEKALQEQQRLAEERNRKKS